MHSEELCCHTVEKTFFESVYETIVTIFTYSVFVIDDGTIVNQQLSNLDIIFFTCYTEGRRIRLILWNKGYGNSSYEKSLDIETKLYYPINSGASPEKGKPASTAFMAE
jgi:hypothetical protein